MRPRRPLLSPLLLAAACAAQPASAPTPPDAVPTVPTAAPAPPPTISSPAPDPAISATAPDLPAVPVHRPCPADSRAYQAARDELAAIEPAIAALPPDGDPGPLTQRINRLIADNPCFALLIPDRRLKFTGTRALREFWAAGGGSWLAQVLHFSGPEDQRHAWLPPTVRKPLTRETHPNHPLVDLLLCAEADPTCGAETEPWRRRALTFFRMFDQLRALRRAGKPPADVRADCEARALAEPVADRFLAWHACFAADARPHTMLPLGSFRAPHDGWLIVRGRRGHYNFCDELRAYDLATGAAYIARSCSGLVLTDGGGVDRATTDAARKPGVTVGRLHIDALREAAWMTLLAAEVQHDVLPQGHGWHIPASIPILVPVDRPLRGGSGSSSRSSDQTTLTWSWAHAGRRVAAGTLTWPDDHNDAARQHAVHLLDIAEAGLSEGCAPARLPDLSRLTTRAPRVSPIDAAPDSVSRVQSELLTALTRLQSAPICPQSRP